MTPLVVLGLMSGTSVDAIDAAVVEIEDAENALALRLLAYAEQPVEGTLRDRILAVVDPGHGEPEQTAQQALRQPVERSSPRRVRGGSGRAQRRSIAFDSGTGELDVQDAREASGQSGQIRVDPERRARGEAQVAEICELNVLVAEAFAAAGSVVLRQAGVQPDLIASHGQTIWHEVRPDHVRSTLQIGEPSVLAERLGATVVADFRPRDIAAGGQGAPLSAWADALLFGHDTLTRAVQNIGGMANVTWLAPAGQTALAFDTGPGNALIDHAVWRITGGAQRYDRDGALAAAGRVDSHVLAELLAMPYFGQPPPKTTGRELFGAPVVDRLIDRLRPADLVATLTAFTAHAIADQYRRFLPRPPDEVVLGGGGSRNPVLIGLLTQLLDPARVRLHEEFGLPSLGREAISFALLGYETLHGRPNTIPACTGAAHPVTLGKLIPGPNYRALLDRVLARPDQPTRKLIVLR